MPRQVTLFTDDGQWAAIVTAWAAHYVVYHDLGVWVRVYRMGRPHTRGSEHGPWSRLGWLGGPWDRGPWNRGPWDTRGPWHFKLDGPWQFRQGSGPWRAALPWPWVETRAQSIAIETRYRGAKGRGELTRRLTAAHVSFLRLTESGFGRKLKLPDDEHKPVPVESLSSTVDITLVDGVTLKGHVTTEAEGAAR